MTVLRFTFPTTSALLEAIFPVSYDKIIFFTHGGFQMDGKRKEKSKRQIAPTFFEGRGLGYYLVS